MKHSRMYVARVIVIALVAVLAMTEVAIAQSTNSAPVGIQVLPYECAPVGVMSTNIGIIPGETFDVPYKGTSASTVGLRVDVLNGNCQQWTLTAQLGDFKLTTDPNVTFTAGGKFWLDSSSGLPVTGNPMAVSTDRQPPWVQSLPADLDTGVPTMPGTVTFAGSPTAVGNGPILAASTTAAYGSPGTWNAWFLMHLDNVPTDLPSGYYHSDFTITVQGPG